MRYLSVCMRCFIDVPAGAERVAWDMLLAMKARGHEVAMVCFAHLEQPYQLCEEQGVTILRIAFDTPRTPLSLWTECADAQEAFGTTLGHDLWDVVHIHSPTLGHAVLNGLTHAGRFPTVLTTVHSPVSLEYQTRHSVEDVGGLGGWLKKTRYRLAVTCLEDWEEAVLKRSHRIHCLSDFTRQKILVRYPALDADLISVCADEIGMAY